MGEVSAMLQQGRGSARRKCFGYESAVVLLLLIIVGGWAPLVVVHGAEFVVGGSSNWTNPSSSNNLNKTFYEDWEAGKTFHVDDVLRFYYNRVAHSVVEVDQSAFNDCNILKPKSIHKDGDTTVRLDRTGSWYFICGTPGHCSDGQKLSIDVQNGSATSTGSTPSGSFMLSVAASLALATAMAASISIFLFAL